MAYHANIHPSSLVLSMEAHGRATRRTAHPTLDSASLQADSGGAAVSNCDPRSISGVWPPPRFAGGRALAVPHTRLPLGAGV